MPEIRVDVYRELPFEIEAVYRCFADFERAQPRLLGGMVRDYAVRGGGRGEGTVVSCAMTIRGRERAFVFRVAEPIPTKIITAYDHDSRLAITWHVRPDGGTTEAEIEAYWSEPDSTFGFLKGWWANIVVRRMLNRMLDRLPAVIEETRNDHPAATG